MDLTLLISKISINEKNMENLRVLIILPQKKLPQGLSVSPYIQRVMLNILTTLFTDLPIKFLIYLDDILLMGSKTILEKAKLILLASSFLFNEEKCVLTPTRLITYLGVVIDLGREVLSLTKKFVIKISKKRIKVKNYFLTKRYKKSCGICTFNKHICARMLFYCISAYVRVYLHSATSVVAPLLAFQARTFQNTLGVLGDNIVLLLSFTCRSTSITRG